MLPRATQPILIAILPGGGFYDALGVNKGPSLGTNFTLACPYTLLAHYTELSWAASYGVESELVRISVGLEPVSTLKDVLASALNAAHHADDAGGNLEVVERLKRELAASHVFRHRTGEIIRGCRLW